MTLRSRLRGVLTAARDWLDADLPDPSEWPQAPASGRQDAVSNYDLGIGYVGRDKRLGTLPQPVQWLTDDQLEALFCDGIGHRLCETPATECVRAGWRVDMGETDRDLTADLDRDLKVRAVFSGGLMWAREAGACYVLPVEAGQDNFAEELAPGQTIDPVRLLVIQARHCLPIAWDDRLDSEGFGRPLMYDVTIQRPGFSKHLGRVHASRLIRIGGLALPDGMQPPYMDRDLPALQAYWPAIRDLQLLQTSTCIAGMELSTPWVKIGAGRTALAGGESGSVGLVQSALRTLIKFRSMLGISVLANGPPGMGDEIGRDNVQMTGLRDVMITAYEHVVSVEDFWSLTRLFGQAPSGMSTNDETGEKSWYAGIGVYQVQHLEPALQRFYTMVRGPEPRRTITWMPLSVPTEKELAEIDKLRAERDKVLIEAVVIEPKESRARYLTPEVLPFPVVTGAEPPEPPEATEDDMNEVDALTGGSDG